MRTNPFHTSNPDFGKLYVFGAGGSGREVAWLAAQSWGNNVDAELVVDQAEFLRSDVNGRKVILLQDMTENETSRYVIALGDPATRRRIASLFDLTSLRSTSIVHPRAEMSDWVELGSGSIVCAGSIVTTNVSIGNHVHVNIGCTISHDVIIGDFTTLSPGVHISGNVHIGKGVFIGTGANIINGSHDNPLVIGDDTVVAAGACVTKHVLPGTMVAGVPAVRKR